MDRYSRPPVLTGAQAQLDRDRAFAEQREAERERQRAKRQAEIEARDAERARKVAEWNAADEKECKEREAKRETERLERVTAEANTLKAQMRERFLRTPGSTVAGFEKAWPRLLESIQLEQTLSSPDMVTQLKNEMLRRNAGADFFEKQDSLIPVVVESD